MKLTNLFEATTARQKSNIDYGLMTRQEFLAHKNSEDKSHSDDAYDFKVVDLNKDYSKQPIDFETRSNSYDTIYQNKNGFIFTKFDNPVAVLVNGVIYYTFGFNPNKFPNSIQNRNGEFSLKANSAKQVKFLDDALKMVDDVASRNMARYPVVINRFKRGDEIFTIRTESPYKKNSGQNIAILNRDGYVVAQGSDEWGATLLTVAKEYRGKGLGKVIGKVWYKLNPKYTSGGFTPSGRNNAVAIWADTVRDYLASGFYSDMIKAGEISKEKVKEILAGLPEKRAKKEEPKEDAPQPLIFSDEGQFIIYDKKFIKDQDEKYIYGFGFFRENSAGDTYLFKIGYEKKFGKIASYVALQLAKNEGFKVYIKSPPSDTVEFEGLENVEIEDDFAWLTKDVIPLADFNKVEQAARKDDKYQEVWYSLVEMANSKWD